MTFLHSVLLATVLALTSAGSPETGLFPEPRAALTLGPAGGGEASYKDLIAAFQQTTGLEVVYDEHLLEALARTHFAVEIPITIEPSEVYRAVETLLAGHGYLLVPVVPGRVFRLAEQEQMLKSQGVFVPEAELAAMAHHPAVIVWTVIHLNMDVRQISNSLRSLLTDAGTQSAIPLGNTNSLLLRGPGPLIADLVRVLHETDQVYLAAMAALELAEDRAEEPPAGD